MNLLFFFFNDTATTEIYTLSLHDALPISEARNLPSREWMFACGDPRRSQCRHHNGLYAARGINDGNPFGDRKSTRLNSSHGYISYAVFCLKKKKKVQSPYHMYTR